MAPNGAPLMTRDNDTHFEVEEEDRELFSITPHSLSRHKTLSMAAGFLLIYLLSHNLQKYQIKMASVKEHFKGRCGQKSLYKMVNELIEHGFIHREAIKRKNRFSNWVYRVSSKPKFKNISSRGTFDQVQNEQVQNDHTKEYQESSLDKTIYKKRQEEEAVQAPIAVAAAPAPSLPSSRKKIKESKEEVVEFVFLTPTQQQKLLQRLDSDTSKLHKCYEKLSNWKIGKGISGGQNDYMAIINWVIDAVIAEENKPIEVPLPERNRAFAMKVKALNLKNPDIEIGPDYLELRSGPMRTIHEKFTDKDFKHKIIKELNNKNLSTKGLE